LVTDEILVTQARQGDLKSFEELVTRYQRQVFAITYRMTSQYQEAEDVTQEVFLAVFHKLYQFDADKKFSPWIQRIAVNTCISALRKKNRMMLQEFDDAWIWPDANPTSAHTVNPQLAVERKELGTEINQALMELPDSYRIMLVLRYQLDLDNREISAALGITKENVEVKVHRARRALRRILSQKWQEKEQHDGLPGIQR
jgi:RNA polymerase sigma-70 factor, ECF subfamily